MRPLAYSTLKAKSKKDGWQRAGENIAFYKSANEKYNVLTFEIEFEYSNDRVYIANSYPYTYSDLNEYLLKVATETNDDRIRTSVLCKSNAGNDIHEVVISNFDSSAAEMAARKAIVLAGRVHPGEVQSSWMLQGSIDFLISDEDQAKYLRQNFVFKIIPM
jgi:cytosolic carboxypeptidase protein 2/3